MLATPRGFGYQPNLLQTAFYPGIAALPAILAVPGIKMLCIPARMALTVALGNTHDFIHRCASMRHLHQPPVNQPLQSFFPVPVKVAAKCPFTYSKQPCRFFLAQPPTFPAQPCLFKTHLPYLL